MSLLPLFAPTSRLIMSNPSPAPINISGVILCQQKKTTHFLRLLCYRRALLDAQIGSWHSKAEVCSPREAGSNSWRNTAVITANLNMLSPRLHNFVSYAGAALCFLSFSKHPTVFGSTACTLWVLHFARRCLETVFLFNFSSKVVPLADSVTEFIYYWVFAAWLVPQYQPMLMMPLLQPWGSLCGQWRSCSTSFVTWNLQWTQATKKAGLLVFHFFLTLLCPITFSKFCHG